MSKEFVRDFNDLMILLRWHYGRAAEVESTVGDERRSAAERELVEERKQYVFPTCECRDESSASVMRDHLEDDLEDALQGVARIVCEIQAVQVQLVEALAKMREGG